MMTIKQLKQILNGMDDNLKAFIYAETSENWGSAHFVKRCKGKEQFPYTKGDAPDNLEERLYGDFWCSKVF